MAHPSAAPWGPSRFNSRRGPISVQLLFALEPEAVRTGFGSSIANPSIEDGKAAAEDVPVLADTRKRAQPGVADPIRRASEEALRSAGLMKWRGSSPKPAKGSNKPDARSRPACSEVPFA